MLKLGYDNYRNSHEGNYTRGAYSRSRPHRAIYRVPKYRLGWDCILIRLRLYFNQAITNGVNTHVLVLSVKVRRNNRLKHHTLINHTLHILTYGDN